MRKIITTLVFMGAFVGSAVTSSAEYFNNAPIYTCNTQLSRSLSVGASGSEVLNLQNFLYKSGYFSANPNGYFGQATKMAVRIFQRDNSISQTGTVGPATRNAINERICGGDYSYNSNGYNTGVTYVDNNDPYVKVITPSGVVTGSVNNIVTSANNYTNNYNSYTPNNLYTITPATTNTNVTNSQVIYNPLVGYTYGITPSSGSVTITSPTANSFFREGDTVNLNWSLNNFNASQFQVILESSVSGQSKIVSTVSGNSTSFVLTRELLDAVCAGACNTSQQTPFKISLVTPYSDIAGNVTPFKATVQPVTIYRPYSYYGGVSLTSSKTPVNSGEIFRLYVNVPTGASWNSNLVGPYSFKVTSICPSGVTVSMGGVGCGQEFSMPNAPLYIQQEIPVMASNNTWFTQGVAFNLSVFNQGGQLIGTASTTVQVNSTPFSW